MAKIEDHKYSIEEAFRECFYIVPDYQREYVWTEKEVHQLLDDIDEQFDAGDDARIFHRHGAGLADVAEEPFRGHRRPAAADYLLPASLRAAPALPGRTAIASSSTA